MLANYQIQGLEGSTQSGQLHVLDAWVTVLCDLGID